MYLDKLIIKNHPFLGNIDLDFINHNTDKPYRIVALVGENGCGKTTILDLLFNYENSDYIANKKDSKSILGSHTFCGLFLRQNSLYNSAQSELVKSISGKEILPLASEKFEGAQNVLDLRRNCNINNISKGQAIIDSFNDETISRAYKEGKIKDVSCGGLALEQINGAKSPIDITNLSSGQQELILKINNLQKAPSGVDYLLFDEPETSLHPKWQTTIITKLEEMISNENDVPQIFVATHSEKVLESLLNKDDVLIIRLSKENGTIKREYLYELPLCLPRPTFSEINYIIFKIPSFDYHNMLVSRLGYLIGKEDITHAIDKFIYRHEKNNPKSLKTWVSLYHGEEDKYFTLPIYIRHYYHHPRDNESVSEEELIYSIKLLRALIKDIVDQEKNDIM